jgi:branched-chain amino acid transport system substrate-binding protein
MLRWSRARPSDERGGPIAFDDKGDLTVQNPVWYVWRAGTYVPLDQSGAGE